MSGGKRAALLAGVAAAGFAAIVPYAHTAWAEGAPPRLSFDLGETLTSHSNYDLSQTSGPATTLDTILGINYIASTRLQTLKFSASGLLRATSNKDITQSGFQQPNVQLSYQRATEDAKLSASASYQRQRSSDTTTYATLPDGTLSPQALVNSGTVTNRTEQFSLDTGLRAPIGFSLTGSSFKRTYSGASGPDVYNSLKRNASGMIKLHSDQTTEYDLGVTWSRERDENVLQTRRLDTGAYLGLVKQARGLTFSSVFGYMRSTTSYAGGLPGLSSSGLYGSLGIARKTATGRVTAKLESARDSLGLRNTLSLGTETTFHNGGKLAATVGLSDRAGENLQPIGQITYGGDLPNGSYSLALNRSISLDANNIDVAYTQLSAGYTRKINEVSDVGLALSVSQTSGVGSGSYDSGKRQSLTLSYDHALTRDWKLSTGIEHSRGTSGTGYVSDNSAFLSLKRSFTLLP